MSSATAYYVGATRASDTLTVLDGFFDGPRTPIFADGLPGHEADTTTGAATEAGS